MILDSPMPTIAYDHDINDSLLIGSMNSGNIGANPIIANPNIAQSSFAQQQPMDESMQVGSNTMMIPQQQPQPQQQQFIDNNNIVGNLDLTTNYVDLFLQTDSFFPQLTDLLKVSPGFVSISGRRDYDYPNLDEYGNSLKTLSQFVGLKTIPLPKLLIEQFGQMVQRCEMGIFTEIGRAWLAIDTNVYLWKYDTGTDVAYYDSLSRMILKVKLVKPKQGVLKSHIKYLLILVTYTEILLLGITFNESNNDDDDDNDEDNNDKLGDIFVMPEPLFTISTDNIEIKIIESTDDGRIFYGGNDGSLYEINYYCDNSWFNNGYYCYKINHTQSTLSFLIPKILKNSRQVPIKQIEIDKSRNILYTLNDDGDIEVYDLGVYNTDANDKPSTTAQRICQKSSSSITREAINAASSIDEVNFKSIVSINSIEECESIYINLVAVTRTGVRLYFTATSLNAPEQRPFGLTLLHIRLPPGFSASSQHNRPTSVQQTYYKKGNFIFISYQTDNKDTLWALSSDSFSYRQELSELYTIIPLKTRIWSMSEEVANIEYKPYQSLTVKNKTFALETPSIVMQHIEMPKKFIFLTTQGVIIGYKPRLIDQLRQLLIENQGYDNDSVKSFFHLHNCTFQSNACVFALILACDSQPVGDEKIIEWATSAFFHYGSNIITNNYNQPQQQLATSTPFISTPIQNNPKIMIGAHNTSLPSPVIRTTASNDATPPFLNKTFNRFDHQTPTSAYGQQQMQQQQPQIQAQQYAHQYPLQNYSPKCRGLFIYFSRIIRPIWNLKCLSITMATKVEDDGDDKNNAQPKEILTSNISIDEIKIYIQRLTSLYNFLKNNMKFSSMIDQCLLMNEPSSTMNQPQQQQIVEKQLIFNLFKLIEHCLEVLNLWKLLLIHQFHVIIMNYMTKEKQAQLIKLNFKELIVYGSEMTTHLASALVQRFIEDHSTTDIINRRLQDVCPSIYKNENALHAKVHEMILKSKTIENENDRQILLENALKLCKKIGPRINLYTICELFQSINWYEAIVDICLQTSQQRDPQSLSLHYYKNRDKIDMNNDYCYNQPTTTTTNNNPNNQILNIKQIYESRCECYRLLLDIYGRLIQQSKSLLSPRTSSTTTATNELTPDDAKKYAQIIFNMATKSDDELFHYTLYNWLYEHNQMDKLLEIKSKYLEQYLKDKTTNNNENETENDSIALMDFLWLYYERNGHFNAAAEILTKLAELNSNEIPLIKRIEYLSRAIVCMKSIDTRLIHLSSTSSAQTLSTTYGSAGEFLHILEEKIEVARIQLLIMNSLEKLKPSSSSSTTHYDEAIKCLNNRLLNVTVLYSEFAEPFHLYECQLKILHCAGHDDISLIENIWKQILEQELRQIRLMGVDQQTRQTLLRNKIKELGQLYKNTEKFFPLELIITIIESSNQSMKTSSSSTTPMMNNESYWFAETLLNDLKIPLIDLYEIYHKIYKSKLNYTKSIQTIVGGQSTHQLSLDPIKLLEILIYLINQLDNCHIMDRQYFATKALDLISGYLNDLLLLTTSDDIGDDNNESNDKKLLKLRSELNRTKLYLQRTFR